MLKGSLYSRISDVVRHLSMHVKSKTNVLITKLLLDVCYNKRALMVIVFIRFFQVVLCICKSLLTRVCVVLLHTRCPFTSIKTGMSL